MSGNLSNNMIHGDEITPKVRQQTIQKAITIKEDFLSADPPIPGQNFYCISFLSPESYIKKKCIWMFKEYLKDLCAKINYDPNLKTNKPLPYSKLMKLFMDNKFTYSTVENTWEAFLLNNEQKLTKQYDEENDFQTSTRGVKVRGAYESHREAQFRAEKMGEKDKNFHVFVGQMGHWCPWDPSADYMKKQKHKNEELNALMKGYQENRESKKLDFEKNKEQKLKEAHKRNEAIKRKNKRLEKKRSKEQEKKDKKQLARMRKIMKRKDEIMAKILKTQKEQKEKKTEQKEQKEEKEEKKEEKKQTTILNETKKTLFDKKDPWLERKEQQQSNKKKKK